MAGLGQGAGAAYGSMPNGYGEQVQPRQMEQAHIAEGAMWSSDGLSGLSKLRFLVRHRILGTRFLGRHCILWIFSRNCTRILSDARAVASASVPAPVFYGNFAKIQ